MKKLYEENDIQNIAESIRNKAKIETKFKVSEMAAAINSISTKQILQAKTATPSETQQTITADEGYDALSSVKVGAISSSYIGTAVPRKNSNDVTIEDNTITIPSGYYAAQVQKEAPILDTSDATATENDLLLNETAYVNGEKITGKMPNNGAVSGSVDMSTKTYTIPAGYHNGQGTVTNITPTSTITNSIINGATNVKQSGTSIDSFTVTMTIPEGYHEETSLSKTFTNILPEIATDATAIHILNGYSAYNDQGVYVTGTMTNNGKITKTLTDTTTSTTIPAGYHDGTGTVSHATVSVPIPSITVSSSGLITASGSWTKGFTTNNSYSNTSQMATKGATTITPSSAQQTAISSGTYATGNIIVSAVPTETKTISENGTYTPNSGKFFSSITVNLPVQYYHTGSTTPSASLGNDGDLYLKM